MRAAIVAFLVAVILYGCRATPAPQLRLVTTTSVGNAGLLDVLTPAYERENRVRFAVQLAGSGRALNMLAHADADVVISHAPEAEADALRTHPDWWYRKIMFNDFLLVGPPEDPAHAKEAPNLDAALQRIAQSGQTFVSRADQSGTHEREQLLWKAAGTTPANVLPTGQGMAVTLRVTAERGGYTLTDRSTWLKFERAVRLVPVFEGDPRLLNTYAVIVGPGDVEKEARAFADWLATGNGRRLIGTVSGFNLWPLDKPRTKPEHIPS